MPTTSKKQKPHDDFDGPVDGVGWVSDDSSFYGDEDQKEALEAQAAAFSLLRWRTEDPPSQLLRALDAADATAAAPRSKLYNPFEGQAFNARQLDETVATFVQRLPPSTTPAEAVDHWIWIANPHSARRETDEDVGGMRDEGGNILDDLAARLSGLEQKLISKGQAAQARALNKARGEAREALLRAAARRHVRMGKWMLFPLPANVDRVWAAVAEATAAGKLGGSAKVAPDDGKGERAARVVCVYTDDFEDEGDVLRVLQELDAKGLARSRGPMGEARGIYYKPDVFTLLDIGNGNHYGLKASLYASRDMLK